uniref:DNA/RNA polymerase n=1 Tax=Mycena chlorophos TaxID=658473 RepID=A0ABQ0L8T7_MYCCL|nr:DNA/RNA polymerase [Mycena chlorophos]
MILLQLDEQGRRRPARYGSLPMSERESRYSQPKLELFGLYRALRHWRLYIVGVNNLRVEVDAKYIAGLLNSPDLQPDAAVNRWIQGILMFHFALVHIPATKFQGPDALSRRAMAPGETAEDDDDAWLDEVALLVQEVPLDFTPSPALSLPSSLLARTRQEADLRDIEHFLRTLESPAFETTQQQQRFLRQATQYMCEGDRLYKRNRFGSPRLVIREPTSRLRILEQAHDHLGHKGVRAMWELLRNRFFWPRMHNDIAHHVASCHTCQVRSTKKMEKPPAISAPVAVFQKVYIDIMLIPKSGSLTRIVAARDDLTGTCEAMAIEDASATTLARFFWTQIYCRYGCPRRVITDNGPEVKAGFEELMKRLRIPHVRVSGYNKHANGVVERGHYTLREAIVCSCGGKIERWPEQLPLALFADQITVSRVTGFSPYQLLHGTDPVLPFDLFEAMFLVTGFKKGMSTADLLTLRIRQLAKLNSDVDRAAKLLVKSRFQSKSQFERGFKHRLIKRDYQAGELVLLRNVGIENQMSTKRKTDDRYLGPYEVVRKNTGGAYILSELDGAVFSKNPVAAFRLLPYITRQHAFMRKNRTDSSTSDEPSESELRTSSDSEND